VSFLNLGTGTLHEHQDYDFRILKDGEVIFSAARQTGQAVLHNVEGTLTFVCLPCTLLPFFAFPLLSRDMPQGKLGILK
jgi:hypothetical protein